MNNEEMSALICPAFDTRTIMLPRGFLSAPYAVILISTADDTLITSNVNDAPAILLPDGILVDEGATLIVLDASGDE